MAAYALTTPDNPYNPFDDFIQWRLCDIEKRHFCCERLARYALTSDQLSDYENEQEIEYGIDSAIKDDFENIYIKVSESDYDTDTGLLKDSIRNKNENKNELNEKDEKTG